MESTGIKDRIQISQETADELIAAGKVHWLTPREDKVIAKGKGEGEISDGFFVSLSNVLTHTTQTNHVEKCYSLFAFVLVLM
jgi:DNA-binding NarL/FixJ family response regulator